MTTEQPASQAKPKKKTKKKKPARKKPAAKRVAAVKPLPPPVALPSHPLTIQEVDPNAEGSVRHSPTFLNSREPKPGEPLSADAEQLLGFVSDPVGDDAAEHEPAAPGSVAAERSDAAALASMLPDIEFDQQAVQDVLEEIHSWLAEKLDDANLNLSERQSRMLGKPTAALLTQVYANISMYLPGWLARACESTPALTGFILALAIVEVRSSPRTWS